MEAPTIIVTGASRGIGAAIASSAADCGAQVVLAARSRAELEQQVQRIVQQGAQAVSVVGDVSRYEDCQKIVGEAVRSFGKIDVLINNAAVIEPFGPVSEARVGEWTQHLAVNVLGPMMMCQLAVPYLRQTQGKVINITSHGANFAIPGAAAYSASKAALNRLSKTLAAEEPSLTVLLFIPGDVDTPMQATIRAKAKGKTTDEQYQFFVDVYEQGRLLPVEKPALAAVGLALKAPLEWSGEIVEWDDARVQELVRTL